MRDLALAQEQVLNHAFTIDRIGNRLPHLYVVERRFLRIERQQV